jgi:hypothetical protein
MRFLNAAISLQGARYHCQCNVSIGQMDRGTVEMIGKKGAAWAALFPTRPEHEVIYDKLAAPIEQVSERLFALRPIEGILLFNLLPGQLAALPA